MSEVASRRPGSGLRGEEGWFVDMAGDAGKPRRHARAQMQRTVLPWQQQGEAHLPARVGDLATGLAD